MLIFGYLNYKGEKTMTVIFFLLSIIALVAFIVGLIKPSTIFWTKSGKRSPAFVYLAAAIVFFIIYLMVTPAVPTSSTARPVSSLAPNSVPSKTESTVTKAESNSASSEDSKIYKFGEEGKIGDWAITVKDVQTTNLIKSEEGSDDNKKTDQIFIVIKLQMKNISNSSAQYSPDNFALGNYKTSARYDCNMEAGETENQNKTIFKKDSSYFGVYDNINPNVPKQTYVVFEVPKDTKVGDMALIANGNSDEAAGFYLK